MDQRISTIFSDEALELTATDKVIILHLAQYPDGLSVEEICHATGSKFRWIEKEVSRLTRLGVLIRIAPNTYTIDWQRGGKQ